MTAVIESERLTKQLGGSTVVSDVSFRCDPGTALVRALVVIHRPKRAVSGS